MEHNTGAMVEESFLNGTGTEDDVEQLSNQGSSDSGDSGVDFGALVWSDLEPGTSIDVVTSQLGDESNWKLLFMLSAITEQTYHGLIDATNYMGAIASKIFVGKSGDLLAVIYLAAGDDNPTIIDLGMLIEYLASCVPWVPDGCTGSAATVWLGRSRNVGSWCRALM